MQTKGITNNAIQMLINRAEFINPTTTTLRETQTSISIMRQKCIIPQASALLRWALCPA